MNTQRLDTSETPHVRLTQCIGDVQISSWQRQGVEVRGAAYRAAVTQTDEISIEAKTAVSLLLPPHSRLTIGRIAGNLTIKHVAGLIGVEVVGGNLTLHNVGNTQVAQVDGQVQGEGLNGALKLTAVAANITLRNTHNVTIEQAGGDVSIQFVNGDVALGEIAGDLVVRTVSGALQATRIGGTARLRNLGGGLHLPQVQGAVHLLGGLAQGEHWLSGTGDLFLYWPTDAPLSLIAEGKQIVNRLKLRDVQETTVVVATAVDIEATHLSSYLTDHKTTLRLQTTERIALLPWNGRDEPAAADESVFVVAQSKSKKAKARKKKAKKAGEVTGEVWQTAVAQGVSEVLLSIELEFGPEWKHRLAALELDRRLIAAIDTGLRRLTPTTQAANQPTQPTQPTSPPALATFHKAEQAVKKSLRQAEESMEVTRGKIDRLAEDET